MIVRDAIGRSFVGPVRRESETEALERHWPTCPTATGSASPVESDP